MTTHPNDDPIRSVATSHAFAPRSHPSPRSARLPSPAQPGAARFRPSHADYPLPAMSPHIPPRRLPIPPPPASSSAPTTSDFPAPCPPFHPTSTAHASSSLTPSLPTNRPRAPLPSPAPTPTTQPNSSRDRVAPAPLDFPTRPCPVHPGTSRHPRPSSLRPRANAASVRSDDPTLTTPAPTTPPLSTSQPSPRLACASLPSPAHAHPTTRPRLPRCIRRPAFPVRLSSAPHCPRPTTHPRPS